MKRHDPFLRLHDAGDDGRDERCRRMVGSDADGAAVASLGLYGFTGRLSGRAVRIAGIGSLCVPRERRGRRYGAALVAAVLERERREGTHLALVFADAAEDEFAPAGFSPLPGEEAACVTALPAPWPGEPAWVADADPPGGVPGLRAGGPDDIETVMRAREACEPPAGLSLRRDRSAWERLLQGAEAGGRLRGERATAIWILDAGAGSAAYAVLQRQGSALRWLEHGAGPGGDRCLDGLFWAAIAAARRRDLSRLEGWSLPRGAAGTTLYPIARRARRRPLLMGRALDPGISLAGLRDPADCRVGELDRF